MGASRSGRTKACKAPSRIMLWPLSKHVKPMQTSRSGRTKACKAPSSLMIWPLSKHVKPMQASRSGRTKSCKASSSLILWPLSKHVNPAGPTLFNYYTEMNTNNLNKRRVTHRLVAFLVFNSVFGRYSEPLTKNVSKIS